MHLIYYDIFRPNASLAVSIDITDSIDEGWDVGPAKTESETAKKRKMAEVPPVRCRSDRVMLDGTWSCRICTFLNKRDDLSCSVCGIHKRR